MKRFFWNTTFAATLLALAGSVGINDLNAQTGGSGGSGGAGAGGAGSGAATGSSVGGGRGASAAGAATGGGTGGAGITGGGQAGTGRSATGARGTGSRVNPPATGQNAVGTGSNGAVSPRATANSASGSSVAGSTSTGPQTPNANAARAAQQSTQTQSNNARNTNPANRATGRLNTSDLTSPNSATSGQNTLTGDGQVTDSRTDGRFSDDRVDDRFTDSRVDDRFTDSRVDDRFTDSRVDDRFTDSRVDDRFTDNRTDDRFTDGRVDDRLTDSRVDDRFTDARQDDRFTDSRVDDRFSDSRVDDRFTDSRVDDRFSDPRATDRIPDARVTDSTGAQLNNPNSARQGANSGATAGVGEGMSTEGGRPQLGVTFYDSLTNGATVASVLPNTAADRAGLQRGDQIISINGRRFDDYRDAFDYINVFRGSRMDMVVNRDGEQVRLGADLAIRQQAASMDRPSLGLWFNTNNNNARNSFVVGRTTNGSVAYNAGLRSGDQILAIDGDQITSQRAVSRYLADLQPGEQVNIDIMRDGRRMRLDSELIASENRARSSAPDETPAARTAGRDRRSMDTGNSSNRGGSALRSANPQSRPSNQNRGQR